MTTDLETTAVDPMAAVPAIGIHRDILATDYHNWPGASASRLSDLARSPLHCRHRMLNPETADALTIGEAFHLAVLQPHLFDSRFAVCPKIDRRTKDGKAAWALMVEAYGEDRILSADDHERVTAMAAAVRAHPTAAMLLDLPGDVELSFAWMCPRTGVRCKGRADKLATFDGTRVVIDLKSTQDASDTAFKRSMSNYGYHRQAAHYLAGLSALGETAEAFYFIACEKDAPYGVQVFQIDDAALQQGHDELGPLLRTYGECEASGEWPGYSPTIQPLTLPAWAFKGTEAI